MSAGNAAPIARKSLEARATEHLRERIVTGDLPLGERLVETPLAEAYGLSRGTLRAALRRLVEEGLVHQVPYAGYRVVDFSEQDLWELYTLRGTLEALGARLAAERIDATRAARLRAAFEDMMAAAERGDHAAANRGDHALHLLLVQLSGHERLASHYARVENQFRAYIALANRAVDAREIGESHRALVEAVCAGDGARAAELAQANITPLAERHAAPPATQ